MKNPLQDKADVLGRSNNDTAISLSNTDVSAVFVDGSMHIRLFTPAIDQLFNLGVADIGRPLSDFSPRFTDDALLADVEAVLERRVPLEKEILTNDGRHLLRRAQPCRTRDGCMDGVVITFVDISTRIRTEQQLRESEAQLRELNKSLEQRIAGRTAALRRREAELRTLAANVPSMFSYVDADEVYRYVNRLYENRYGLSADQIVHKSVREVLGPENYRTAKPHIDKVLAGEAERYEETFDFADGVRTMDVVYVPEKDAQGHTKGFYVLVHDITERKALEQMLHDREQRLRAIVNTAGDGIITIDREGIVRDFNAAAERMFGRAAGAVIGQDVRVLLPAGCHFRADHLMRLRTDHCLYPAERPKELTGCRQDGTLFPMEITVNEIDHLRLYVVLVRDISERKALEQEIIEVSTLEQERIGRDIHDGIGQQLTALTMLAGSIERRLTAAERSEEARVVRDLVVHLQDTLAQTRVLARGLSPVEIDPEGLSDALSELTDHVRISAGIECHFIGDQSVKVPDKLLAVHLFRIAQEAVHNAIRHGRPRRVEVRLDKDDLGLILSVYDDGTGIKPIENRRSRLGLHIMRYRAGIIGGGLTVESAEGGGTLVRCMIPMVG